MPETLTSRDKIIAFLSKNDISFADIATMYSISKQDVGDYLSGRKKNPAANKLIIRLISDFKIR
ncbi:hypothetical protein LFYK43_14040 [Ligilactobacillus salitolerans]|uniref:HTH cro/C1-type domain-containing protein n=1 Tax=Ligilactobacillus salitolerans TaxID=1808352 RepID=A0A401ITV8_9LACO|nr:XRE family transcriptional regulator [Ligilactobacillus salitolerans]GBG94945.1 hypothetical protein LFYK43_14040 [Ligilactobacillus salitolerans]